MNIFFKIAVAARIFSMRAATIYLYILLAGLCAPAASAAIAINVPATDEDGTYTISWTGMTSRFELWEKRIGVSDWQSIDGGTHLSKTVSGRSAGTYQYRVYNYCPPSGGGSPIQCGQSEGTVVVGSATPSLSSISNVTTNEDTGTQVSVNFSYVGASPLEFSASSSNVALINNLAFSGSGSSTRTLSLTPNPNASGSSIITVTLRAGTKSASTQFQVTVNPVDDAPVISAISNQTLSETSSTNVSFTVTDMDSPVGNVSVSTSNAGVVVPALTGSGSYVLKLTAPRMTSSVPSHQATVTVSVANSPAPVTRSFTVTVTNLSPALWIEPTGTTGVYDVRWDYGSQAVRLVENGIESGSLPSSGTQRFTKTSNGTFTYTLKDCDGSGPSGLVCSGSYSPKSTTVTFSAPTVTASISPSTISEGGSATLNWSSTNATSCSATNISGVSGLGGVATFYAPTVMSANQTVDITVTCSGAGGGGSKTVPVTVNWVNDSPVITTPSPTVVATEDTAFTIPFTVSDEETAAANLVVTAVSSDASKVASISVDRTNNRLNITPVANANGNVSIVLRVTDAQGLYQEKTVAVVISAVDDFPIISAIGNQTLSETNSTNVSFTVSDVDSPVGNVTVSTSNAGVVVPELTASGSYVLKLTAPRMTSAATSHQATVTVSVANTPSPVTRSFTVTVTNLSPELWIEPTGTTGVYDVRWDYGSQAVRLLENDIDPGISLPPSGTQRITKTSSGTFTYTLKDCDGSGPSGLVCSGSYSLKSITVSFPVGSSSANSLSSTSRSSSSSFTSSVAPSSSSRSSTVSSVGFSNSFSSSSFRYSVSDPSVSGSYDISWSGARSNVILYEQVNGLWEYRFDATGSGAFDYPVSGKSPGIYSYKLQECFHGGVQGAPVDNCKDYFIEATVPTGSASSSSAPAFSQVIQAEDYSTSFGVQKESTTDVGGGFSVGYIDVGDWMRYDNHPIVVAKYSLYKITYRVSSLSGGGSFSLGEKNGSTQYDVVQVPSTGGWQTWTNVERIIALPAGTLNLSIRALGRGFNINWFKVEYHGDAPAGSASSFISTSQSSSSSPFSQVIQAEDYSTRLGVVTEGTLDAGGGLHVGYIDVGDWMRYDNHPIAVVESSNYKITYRIASVAGGGSFTLYDTDTNAIYDTVQVPSTGGWQTWRSVERNITLPSGTRRLGIKALTSGFNINWLMLDHQGGAASSLSSSASSSSAAPIDLVKTGTDFLQALGGTAPIDPLSDAMSEPEFLGALMGMQSVGADGSFNYSLPLSIPVGINGTQPKLQLNYNSNSKNGLVGWGWALNGLSVISRCNANMIRDGYVSGIQANDNYKYCIDGQRLVEVSAGEFRTESENFLRIKKLGDYWEVTNNSGTLSRYGYNPDSKLEDDQSQVYVWYLDQQKDVSNNSWSVTYNKFSAGGTQSHYPASISYTNSPLLSALHSIIFHYENREDISVKYVAGMRAKNDKRLAKVEIKSGSATVHSYVLAYQQSGQIYHGKPYSDPAKTSRLANIKLCFGSSLTDCATPVDFDWNEQSTAKYKFTVSANPVLNNPESGTTSLPLGVDSQGNTPTYTYPTPSEANGDLEKTTRYLTDPLNTNYPPLAVTRTISATYRSLDINNDGIKDIVKEYKTRTGIQVYLGLAGGAINAIPSPTYSVASSETFYPALVRVGNHIPQGTVLQDVDVHELAYATQFVDVNNDGLIDLVRSPYECADAYIYCVVSDAPGASKTVAKDISVAINTGSGFSPFVTWHNNWAEKTAFKLSFFDMNSDGTLDFFASASYPGGAQQLIAGFNNGLGATGGAFNVQVMGNQDGRDRFVGDFNGDGIIDFAKMPMKERRINAPAITNYIDVSLGVGKPTAPFDSNTLGGFLPNVRALSGFSPVKFCGNDSATTLTQSDTCTRTVIDFNSDGLADIVEWGERTTIECTNGAPLISETSCGTQGKTRKTIDRESKVYLSLGGGADKLITFANPIIYRDQATYLAAFSLGGGFGGFKDYNNDGNLEDDSRLQNNIHVNRIDAVIESSRRIDVNYSSLASNEIYKVVPAIEAVDGAGEVSGVSTDFVSQPQVLGKRFGVKEIQVSNGIGGTNKTRYRYINAKTHGSGYGDLGFATVEKLDLVAGKTPVLTISDYYQDATPTYKLAGRLKREVVYLNDVSGTKLSDTRYQWKVRAYNDDVDAGYKSPHYFAYLYQSSNKSWELDGTTLISETLTQNRADAIQSCTEISSTPSVDVINAGAANDIDYNADGVLLYSQTATCDQSGSAASVQIKAIENLDITSKGDARALVQKRKQYAWTGSAISSASKSFYDVRTQAFTYNALGQLESKTIEPELAGPNSLKLSTNYLYNGYGSVRSITDTWDDVANDGLEVGARLTKIDETYTNGIRKLVVSKPLNIIETTQFHPWWGAPTKQIDANGIETNTIYDNQGRPERIDYADGTSSQIHYRRCSGCSPYHSNAVWYKQIKTTGSSAVRMYYDGFNREIGSRSKGLTGREAYTIQTYDSRGAPFQSTAPFYYGESQKTLTTHYDALGRVSSVNHPDGSSESRGYYGLRHTTTNRLNQTQTRYLNAAGWVMKSVDNANTPVDFTYWPWGDLKTTQVNNDLKTLVSVAYDKLGRKTEMTDPNTGKTTYTYNALDLVATQTDAKNQRTCFGYDALGRQTKRVDNAGSSCTGTTQSWVYDTKTKGKGQLGSMSGINTDGSSYSEQYSYNNFGLPESTSTSFDGSSYTTKQHYDSFNRPLGVTYPTGYVAANSYNSYGHLDQVKDSTGATLWAANDADALGNIKRFTLGNGVVTTQTYDADTSRIESIRAVSGSLVIQDQHYQFDELGNLRSREDRKNTITQSFCYDGLNRLKAARFNGCTTAANDYNYDPLGNLTTKEGLTGTLGYGTSGSNVAGPHAVTSANGWAYQYDEIGNLKTATKAGEQTKTVNYSPFNTPTSITQGSKFSTLVYGPNQERIKHSDSNGRVTKYVGGIYEEVTKGGVTQKIHYVGDFALFISKGINTSATYAHEYMHRDHIGSIVAISKGKIATVADVSWQANGAWGERRFNQWNGPLDNLLIPTSTAKGFTDHEHLDAVGLIHMNGRVYDPELGRFMSADPFVQAPYNSQSYNRYSYVFNNPLSFTDPSGYTCGQITEWFRATDDETGRHLGTWSQTRAGQSSGGTLCGQDAIDFGRDQDRQNQSWDYMVQSFQISYSPQTVHGYGFSLAMPIEGNSFAGAGCGVLGICLGDSVEDEADIAAAEQVVGHPTLLIAGIVAPGPGGKAKKLDEVGEYLRVRGHHVHAKAAFKSHLGYDPNKGFSISNKFMRELGLDHKAMTSYQRQAFKELSASGRPNSMKEHTRIAVGALQAGGASRELARSLVAQSLSGLRVEGVRNPTNIPWY